MSYNQKARIKMENTNVNENLDVNSDINEGAEETKTYTQDEVLKMIQSESDKRVNQALEKAERKNAKAVAEAQKLAKMDADERAKYESEQKIAEYEKKIAEYQKLEFKSQALEVMAQRNLPTNFADMLVGDDAESTLANIKSFETAFKSAVNDAVSKKIGSNSPKSGNTTQTGLTKESFNKMSLTERMNIAKTNPALYESLSR